MREEREISQFGDVLIWFGLCSAAAIPVWSVAKTGPAMVTGIILPLPILLVLLGDFIYSRVTLFVYGLAYFAALFSPILIWRPAAVRTVVRILIVAGALHLLVIAGYWGLLFYYFPY